MKKFLIVAIFGMILSSISTQAQTTRFTNRNFDERIAQRTVTTDSTLTYMDSVVVATNESGIIQLTMIGYAKDTAHAVTGVIQCRFNKRRGTLTLGTITQVEPITVDVPLQNGGGGATFTLVSINNNIYVRVKGKAGYSITWTSFVKQKSIRTTS